MAVCRHPELYDDTSTVLRRDYKELLWREDSEEAGLPGNSLTFVCLQQSPDGSEQKHLMKRQFRLLTRRHHDVSSASDPFIDSDHRQISCFWGQTDVVRLIHSVYLLLTVTYY